MNYIQKLQDDNKNLRAEIARIKENENRFLVLLNSPKFAVDTTIQVADVINIIRENRRESLIFD